MKNRFNIVNILLVIFLSLICSNTYSQIPKGSELEWSKPIEESRMDNIGFSDNYLVCRTVKVDC